MPSVTATEISLWSQSSQPVTYVGLCSVGSAGAARGVQGDCGSTMQITRSRIEDRRIAQKM